MVKLTIDAVKTVTIEDEGAGKDIDIKRYVRVEKVMWTSIINLFFCQLPCLTSA